MKILSLKRKTAAVIVLCIVITLSSSLYGYSFSKYNAMYDQGMMLLGDERFEEQ